MTQILSKENKNNSQEVLYSKDHKQRQHIYHTHSLHFL